MDAAIAMAIGPGAIEHQASIAARSHHYECVRPLSSDQGRQDSHSDRIVGAELHIGRRLDLAVVIDAAAVVQLQVGIH